MNRVTDLHPTAKKHHPAYAYLDADDAKADRHGLFRRISAQGRVGYHAQSIESRIIIPEHNLNQDQGSLALWLYPLEDLATFAHHQHIRKHDPLAYFYTIVSDIPDMRLWTEARFSLQWTAGWYPQYFVKFYKGNIHPDFDGKAFAAAGHLNFKQGEWYQLGLSWDRQASDYRLYVNGCLVATQDCFFSSQHMGANEVDEDSCIREQLIKEDCGKQLYLGNTSWALSDLMLYDQAFSSQDFEGVYTEQARSVNQALNQDLFNTYGGAGAVSRAWSPGSEWMLSLESSLTDADDLDLFYLQGNAHAARVSDEGLAVNTADFSTPVEADFQDEVFSETFPDTDLVTLGPIWKAYDDGDIIKSDGRGWGRRTDTEVQIYLWTKQSFEGDLCLEFEFKLKKEFGLCLLCLQASGMQREDFMADYPQRKSGSMSMVAWENIRNYHWEWFREMSDCRNDVNSHAVIKQPFHKPLAYGCQSERLDKNVWHTLRFLQEGSHLSGFIDDVLVWEAEDLSNQNSAAVYNCGHIGFRSMRQTHVVYRNLKVYNRLSDYQVVDEGVSPEWH